ncbi:MAG: fibronectin type III domain-containing protein [Paludibacteraceae bacterium]|nr:fibronectin type III domain-containing protein [Paludibacteraceae bacterium]
MKKSILLIALGLILTLGAQQAKAEKEFRGTISSDGKTLTIYYDEQRYDDDVDVTDWWNHWNTFDFFHVTKVVFDESIKTAYPTKTSNWFWRFQDLTTIVHMDYLNTSKVTTMLDMFDNCVSLTSIDLSHFNTSMVTNMSGMFWNCANLKQIDLSNFDVRKVKDMSGMFGYCKNLTTIYCNEDWSEIPTYSTNMFVDCSNIVGGQGTLYSVINGAYARPDERPENPGYFTHTADYCATPTNVKLSNITYNSVTVSWTPGSSSQTKWRVGYYKDQAVGSPVYKYKTVTSPSCTLTDLAANTKYGVRVMAVCGDDKVSAMSPAQNFTTLEKPCVAPTNLSISDITQSSATISWTPGNAADDKWVIYYRHENASNYTTRVVSTNPYTLSDLRFNSTYYVSVATYCEAGKYSEYTSYKTFTTQAKSSSDYVIVTSCAFKGFDHSAVQYGMTWTTEASSAIVQAMSPVDENAVYSLATGGTLYKKNENGVGYTKVANGTSIGEGIYIYVTMVNILPPESENYRFPKSDEGITVVVNVDDQQWNANPKNYNVTDQLSQITINSPDFTVTAPIPDDPQALADARALLEEMIDNYNYLAAMLKELGIGAEILAAMNPVVASAQAVLDNPNATLTEIQNAITTVENEAAKYEEEMLNLLAPYEFEAIKNEAIEYLDRLQLPDDSEDCKKIIEDAKAYVASLTYNNSKSAQENLDDLDDALRKLYAQIEDQLEACRSKVGCEPPTDFKVSNVTATSATISWQPGSPKQTKYALTVIKLGVGPYWDFEQDIEATSITLTDLEPNTKYEAEVEAYCSEGSTDWAAPGWIYFTTQSAQGIDQITNDQSSITNKVLRDGQVIILRNGRTFNAQGAEVR